MLSWLFRPQCPACGELSPPPVCGPCALSLVEHFGWKELATRIRIRCFSSQPSVASSLKFLRRTPWAREQVESLYGFMLRERARQAKRGEG